MERQTFLFSFMYGKAECREIKRFQDVLTSATHCNYIFLEYSLPPFFSWKKTSSLIKLTASSVSSLQFVCYIWFNI